MSRNSLKNRVDATLVVYILDNIFKNIVNMKFDNNYLRCLSDMARKNPRMRQHYDLRDSEDDKCMRMLNAIEPETVIPIHRHTMTSEDVVVLRGKAEEVLYDDNGNEVDRILMIPSSECMGCHVPKGQYHTCLSLESGTVIIEFKNTQYDPEKSEEFFNK